MDNNLKNFGKWMREEREKRSMTQKDLAAKAEVGLSTIQGLEAERAKSLSPRIQEKITKALNNADTVEEIEQSRSIDDSKSLVLRLAALVAKDDFNAQINAICDSLKIPRTLAIVYLFEKELNN